MCRYCYCPIFMHALLRLNNLIKQLDTEAESDDQDYGAFQAWSAHARLQDDGKHRGTTQM